MSHGVLHVPVAAMFLWPLLHWTPMVTVITGHGLCPAELDTKHANDTLIYSHTNTLLFQHVSYNITRLGWSFLLETISLSNIFIIHCCSVRYYYYPVSHCFSTGNWLCNCYLTAEIFGTPECFVRNCWHSTLPPVHTPVLASCCKTD